MRAVLVVGLFVLLCPVAVMAQGAASPSPSPAAASPPPPASAPTAAARGGRDIARDEYIERAKRNAERRFDRIDTNHDSVLSVEERRAARAKRRHKSEPQ
jgi:hypothetical protein